MKKVFTKFKVVLVVLMLFLGVATVQSQSVTDPSSDPNYDLEKAEQVNQAAIDFMERNPMPQEDLGIIPDNDAMLIGGCFIPVDGSYTQVPRNDDGSYGPINLPFNFNLYGTNYTQAYINTNGNITFTGPLSWFSSSGFPFHIPMVAPFWGDVDTRNGGAIYFKLTSTRLIVTWNNVGYYSYQSSRPNKFQAILTNSNDPLIGIGNNVAFYYENMRWTTGNASGGSGGFGGTPATVGVNKGSGSNYVQIGRFNQNNYSYDGPGGANDGVHYLDNKCFAFNISNATNQPPSVSGVPPGNVINLACGETQTINLSFIGPEVAQTVTTTINTGGLCNTTTNVSNGAVSVATATITGSSCNQGSHVISFTATDNFNIPASTIVNITVNVESCCTIPVLTCPTNVLQNNDPGQCGASVTYPPATASGSPNPSITYSHPSGSYFPVGITEVTVTAENSCGTASCSFNVEVVDSEAPTAITQNINLALDANGNASIYADDIDNGSFDNCNTNPILWMEYNGQTYYNTLVFSCSELGPQTVTLGVNDGHGNTSYADAVVTVIDDMAPVISVTSGSNNSSEDGIADCTYTGFANNGGGFYTIESDNCSSIFTVVEEEYFDGNLVSTYTWTLGIGGWHPWRAWPVGVTTMVVTITDDSGNSSSDSYTQTVFDDESPTVLTHDVNIYLDEAGQASTTVEMIDNGSFDNCEMATLVLDNMSFDCGNIGANTVVLTATDVSGNVSSASAVVTVIDAVLPTVLTQDATIYLDDFGQASITVEMIENGSFDNCDIATLSLDNMSFNCGNVGANTVVLTATDVNGNVNAATAMVTVIDEIAPIALCQNISVTLSGGSASITPEMVDNGSNDACGIASLDIDITSFDCSNIGDNPVVLTVTDNNGNISTCDAIVNVIGVIPSCEIDVELENDTYTGGDGLTIFMGYGPQALTAHVLAEGGGPFTYSWTGGGGFLSSTSSGDPVFSPTADGMYTLVCTVTNSFGCETICEVEICVMDIRAGGNGNNAKVYLCHVPNGNHNKAKTLKVSVNAVPGHLNNHEEDRLGRCDQECGSFKVDFVDDAEFASDHEPVLNVYPNPTSNTFSFVLDSHHDEFFDMIIYDHLGRQIMKLDELVPNDIIEFGEDLTGGVYYVNVIQGEYIETLKIIKTQ